MTAISISAVSKRYRLRAGPRPETLFAHLLGAIRGARSAGAAADEFWALRDIGFDVPEGQTLGIIGRNGAGKSTLLKILSRITSPTTGSIRVRGRMASLLEVGTGFHPDLSGRDNVFMNAAILGMSRREIRRHFNAIVQFAGVERFIDTPIRHYSSGMKVRLAFAVAAHLEPDIMVVDEVLAVGDADFQKRCMDRMRQVGNSGHTVLFVSHNLAAIARLCQRSVVLDQGRVVFDGATQEAIAHYEALSGGQQTRRSWEGDSGPGDATVRLQELELLADGAPLRGPASVKNEVGIRIRYAVRTGGRAIVPSVHLYDLSGTPIMSALDTSPEWHTRERPAGTYTTLVKIPRLLLNEGRYTVGVAISTLAPFENHLYLHEGLQLGVVDPQDGSTAMGLHTGPLAGFFRPLLDWETQRVD